MKFFITGIALCLPLLGIGAPSAWRIEPEKSNITFTATQNNAPVTGQFKSFTGSIQFDPEQLNTSHIEITVDLASVTTSYPQVADTLKTSDWFDVKLFPNAIFKASTFTKTADNTYQANGTLTLRDKTLPVTLNFKLETYSKTNATAKGSTTLKRTQFGVGKGDWAKTDEIKDDVQVNFTLTTVKQ